ncbi:MAG: U32 family peptidase [Magnetococcales bacterium]|nr:U32 family peptidase [Magnetococcales bacterium]MBF0323370.1 U32 family peptidase [Magnetococcales bacterium]
MKIAIGPVLYEWGKKGLRDFYRRMAETTSADILYIGEVVCSKRNHLSPEEMAQLAEALRPTGKEIVFSTLGLVMTEEEQLYLRQVIQEATRLGVMFEANDMAGVAIGEGCLMVAGPHITTYNPETLDFLAGVGVRRVVAPVELSQAMIAGIMQQIRSQVEMEVFAYGRLPLTFSARCYTARAFRLPKTNCQYKCGEFPDGMIMKTQEDEPLLNINGVQTLSARVFNLVAEVEQLAASGVKIVRLSPQSQGMEEIVHIWHERLSGRMDVSEALQRLQTINHDEPFCNGYYHGRAGLDFVAPPG